METTPSLNACFEEFILLEKFVVGCDEGACNRGSASGMILTSIRDSGDSGIFGESLVKSTAAMAREPRSPTSIREQAVGELGFNRQESCGIQVYRSVHAESILQNNSWLQN